MGKSPIGITHKVTAEGFFRYMMLWVTSPAMARSLLYRRSPRKGVSQFCIVFPKMSSLFWHFRSIVSFSWSAALLIGKLFCIYVQKPSADNAVKIECSAVLVVRLPRGDWKVGKHWVLDRLHMSWRAIALERNSFNTAELLLTYRRRVCVKHIGVYGSISCYGISNCGSICPCRLPPTVTRS